MTTFPSRTGATAAWLRAADGAARADRPLRRLVLTVGVVFLLASTPKFLAYGWEVDNFRRFGLPLPGPAVLLAGVLELVGGALLLAGRIVLPACVVLVAVMLVAIATSGVGAGDVVPSLTLAPALALASAWIVVRTGRLARRSAAPVGAPVEGAPRRES